MPRPFCHEWQKHLAEYPFSEREQAWIRKYKRSLYEQETAVFGGAPRWRHDTQKLSQYLLNSPQRAATHSKSLYRGRGDTRTPRLSRS